MLSLFISVISCYIKVSIDSIEYNGTNLSSIIAENKIDQSKIKQISFLEGFFDIKTFDNKKFPIIEEIIASNNTVYGDIINFQFEKSQIHKIVLPNIRIVNMHAFDSCSMLEFAQFDNCSKISDYAFYRCSKLEKIIVHPIEILSHAFFNCSSLKEFDFSQTNRILDQGFSGCSNLNGLVLKNQVTLFQSAFAYTDSFQEVILENVASIPSSCFESSSVTKIIAPNCRAIGDSAFQNCKSLGNANFEQLLTISYGAFRDSGIKTINAPKLNWINNLAFKNCVELNSINFENLTRVDFGAFLNSSLMKANINNCQTLGELAFGFTKITKINLPNCKTISASCFESSYIQIIEIPQITEIADKMFMNCHNLKKLTLNQITKIGISAFQNSSLTEIELNSCTEIGSKCFAMCSIQKINLPNCIKIGSESFEYSLIQYINLSKCVSIGKESFKDCIKLKELRADSLEKLNYSYFNDDSVLEVLYAPNVTQIDTLVLSLLKNLKDLQLGIKDTTKLLTYIPKYIKSITLTNVEEISMNLFKDMMYLEEINIPSAKYLNHGCFENCFNLEVVRADNVLALEGDSVFAGCSKIKSIKLPNLKTVQKRFRKIFDGCISLRTVSFGEEPPLEFADNIFQKIDGLKLDIESVTFLKNYISQSDVNENGEYVWKGIRTGITRQKTPSATPIVQEKSSPVLLTFLLITLTTLCVALVIFVVLSRRRRYPKDYSPFYNSKAKEY